MAQGVAVTDLAGVFLGESLTDAELRDASLRIAVIFSFLSIALVFLSIFFPADSPNLLLAAAAVKHQLIHLTELPLSAVPVSLNDVNGFFF